MQIRTLEMIGLNGEIVRIEQNVLNKFVVSVRDNTPAMMNCESIIGMKPTFLDALFMISDRLKLNEAMCLTQVAG